MAPVVIKAVYHGEVMNKGHLDSFKRPINSSSRPVENTDGATKTNNGRQEETDENLTMYQYVRQAFIQSWGMETVQDYQPDVQMGGKLLLQKMDLPQFTQRLLQIAQATKMSLLDTTLQRSLLIGYALSVWGAGKNPITVAAKTFVIDLFQRGQEAKPVPAADAVIMMQKKTDVAGVPVFNENSFLDEDQIKSIFGTTSRKRKRSLTDPKKSSSTTVAVSVGVDFDDQDNGEAKQRFEQQLADYEIRDQAAAVQKDSDQIKEDLERSEFESDQHPIKVAGVDLCQIAERMDLKLSVDSLMEKQTPQQAEAIFTKLEAFEVNFLDEPPAKKRRTKLRKKNLIFNYVKHNCHCVAFSFYK